MSEIITYFKQKYYPGGVVIGKERSDIINANPDDTIRVAFGDQRFVFEAKRSNICKVEAPVKIAEKYGEPGKALGAFMDPESAYTKVSV